MGIHDHGYDDILHQVHRRFGFTPTIFNSGGNIMILEARLDGGDLIWITDADCDVTPLPRRLTIEADGHHVGWQVSIYPPETQDCGLDIAQAAPHGQCAPSAVDVDSCTPLASVIHQRATTDQLPELIELALRARRRHEHHIFALDGTHTVRAGIDRY